MGGFGGERGYLIWIRLRFWEGNVSVHAVHQHHFRESDGESENCFGEKFSVISTDSVESNVAVTEKSVKFLEE